MTFRIWTVAIAASSIPSPRPAQLPSWVAPQLGHTNPELTLRVYAHALREEETDRGFLDLGNTERHPDGIERRAAIQNENAPDESGRGHSVFMEHETRFELIESIAFDTLTLARRCLPCFD